MKAEFAVLERQIAALNAQIEQVVIKTHTLEKVNPRGYAGMVRAASAASKTFRDAANSTGMLEASQLRLNSATDEYVKRLQKEKISFRQWYKDRKLAAAAYREQLAMADMYLKKMPGMQNGKNVIDFTVPTQVHESLNTVGKQIGWIRQQTASAATQMVNWGKNTQWAGRQLMVGFTMPVAAFGAAAGALAYQVDKQITRIQKVYDTQATNIDGSNRSMAATEAELAKVRSDSLATATNAAKQYGASAKDTLGVQAELAATGKRGAELQAATTQVMRAATLGEMDYAIALKSTIALQSVFRMDAEKLAETWNYMNSVENATSLTMEDFATAIPIAAAPIKQMGGDIQTLGVLMTAMKARGIQAAQGANAIKASMQRLFRPSRQIREEFQAITGASIVEIRDRNKGNIVNMLKDLYEVTKNLSNVDKTKAFAGLFGSYQVTRMSALVNGMGELNDSTTQVGKAFEIAGQSAQEWADTSDGEVRRWQQSVSGRFKATIETLKIQLAEAGQPFVEIATKIAGLVSKIITKFNELSPMKKKIAAYAAIFMALIGPVIMLTGLTANLVGNILKFGVSITGFLGKMEILDRDSRAAKIAAELAAQGFTTEASAVQKLAEEMAILAKANQAAARTTRQLIAVQQGMSPAKVAAIGAVPSPRDFRGQQAVIHPNTQAAKDKASMARKEKEIADNAERGASASKAMGASMVVMGVAMGANMITSNKLVNDLANMAMYAAMIGPAIAMVPWKGIAGSIAAGATRLKGGFVPGMKAAGLGAKDLFMNFWRFAGPQALLVGAIAGMVVLNKKINQGAKEMRALSDSGQNWSKIYGYAYRETGTLVDPKTGQQVKNLTAQVKELNSMQPEVAKWIREAATDTEKMNIAIRQGLNVISHGGTADQARNAVRASLMAGIEDINKVNELMADVDLKVKFNVNKDVIAESVRQAMVQVKQYANDALPKGRVELAVDLITGNEGERSEKSKQAIKDAAQTFFQQWSDQEDATKIAMIRKIQQSFREQKDAITEGLFANSDIAAMLKDKGINNGWQLAESFGKNIFSADDIKRFEKAGFSFSEIRGQLFDIDIANGEFTKELAKQAGLEHAKINSLEDFNRKTVAGYISREDAQKKFNVAMQDMNEKQIRGGAQFTDQQRLQILNQLRMATGLERTGNLLDGFGPVTQKWTEDTDKQERAVTRVKGAYASLQDLMASIKDQDIWSMLKGAMNSFQEGIADATSSAFTDRMNAAMDQVKEAGDRQIEQLRERQDRQDEAFSKRWSKRKDKEKKYYTDRIENIKKQIEAEKKNDEIRQKMFEAEMARLDRLAEMANRNIDFNLALKTGNLDEAAKIRNDAAAQAADWALQDQMAADKEKGNTRVDKMNAQVTRLEKLRDKRMKHLDEIEKAQKKSLDRQQKREADALKKSVDNNIKAEQKKWDYQKKRLDSALKHFLGYTATSERDLRNHIKNWNTQYGEFNLVTEGEFNTTSKNIANYLKKNLTESRREFVNGKDWELSGNQIADSMLKGAFGMTTQQFRKWLVTGVFPSGAKPPTAKDIKKKYGPGGTAAQNKVDHMLARHEGGPVDGSTGGSRAGYAKNAPLSRSEQVVLAEKGEYMVNKHAAKKHSGLLNAINSGSLTEKTAGIMGGSGAMGFSGLMGAMMQRVLYSGIQAGIMQGAINALAGNSGVGYVAGKGGVYGDVKFTPEQLNNAATIASIGSGMGMSKRDIEIAIMTAITESSLRNLPGGDRDSAGLFQQRPSQGWGSLAQVTDPVYSATKFFNALRGVKDRGKMSPWLAAQAVQRSAFSDGSNYRQYWQSAMAIFNSLGFGGTGSGGKHKPVNGGTSSMRIHDQSTGYPAIDIALPVGSPVYAVGNGTIGISRDYVGNDGRQSNGGYYSYGRYITLDLDGGGSVNYAHLAQRYAKAGQRVLGGAVIGLSGNTGHSFGPHLHFGARGGISPTDFYPQLKVGGFTLSDGLAKLHRGEMVATAPMTEDIKRGVRNFADGGKSEYNVNVYVTEPGASADDIANAVETRMRRREARKPRKRKE